MRIISSYRDYYDGVTHQFRDESLVYVREFFPVETTKKEELKFLDRYEIDNSLRGRKDHFSLEVIGFCGKLYPVVCISQYPFEDSEPARWKEKVPNQSFYDIKTLTEFVKRFNIPIEVGGRYTWYWSRNTTLKGLQNFLETPIKSAYLNDVFIRHNIPTFVAVNPTRTREVRIVANPMLQNYSFMKVMDPYSASQELSMYAGSVLRKPEKEMIPLTDEEKVQKRGFDKWSFRKPPGGKKRRAKKNS